MLCEDCEQRVATVVYTEVRDGATEVRHLCQQCVEERGIHAPDIKSPLESESTFEGILEDPDPESPPNDDEQNGEDELCPTCNWSFARFRRTGRFGCPDCYEAFEERLKVLLRQIHGSTEHLGKIYADATAGAANGDVETLRVRLEEAIDQEAFEKAADLRDRIRQLELRRG
jgi:protein arginine kinase activator